MTTIKITLSCKGGFKSSRGTYGVEHSVEEEVDDDLLAALAKPRRMTRLMKAAMAKLQHDEVVVWKRITASEVVK